VVREEAIDGDETPIMRELFRDEVSNYNVYFSIFRKISTTIGQAPTS